jgi:ribose transport system substrate-binding protein
MAFDRLERTRVTPGPVIGLSAPTLEAAAVKALLQGLAYVAEGRGATVLVADAKLDGECQRVGIDALVREGVDALLVYPTVAPEILRPALDDAAAVDVPLFGHDALKHPAVITEFVTPGAEMAALAAGLMNEFLEGRGAVCLVGGVPAPQIVERVQAFERTVAERFPGLNVVAHVVNEADDRAGACERLVSLLTGGATLDGIFAYNDASALGAADAIEVAGGGGIVVVGCNGEPECLPAIRDGRMAGTVERYPIELGQRAATIILDVVTGALPRGAAPPRVASEPEIITRANVERFLPWPERTPQPDWSRTCRFL